MINVVITGFIVFLMIYLSVFEFCCHGFKDDNSSFVDDIKLINKQYEVCRFSVIGSMYL